MPGKGAYLKMARREKFDSPELKAFDEDRQFVRKKAGLREAAAKEAADIQLKARRHTEAILEEMIDLALSETPLLGAKIQAAQFVFDRAYGKAAQTNINANVNANGKPSEITGSALTKRVEATLKRIEELTGGRPEEKTGPDRSADVCLSDRDPNSPTKH